MSRRAPVSITLAATFVLSALAACGEGRYALRRGVLADVEVPDVVVAGETFAVRVRTYGGGCDREGRTRVSVSGDRAVVEPFDWFLSSAAEVACPAVASTFRHEVSLRFDAPGEARVVIRARRFDRAPEGNVVDVEVPVVVRRTGTEG